MEIEETIEIAAPVPDVQAYLADPAKLPEWIDGLVEFELKADGSFHHVISQMGRKLPVEGRLVAGAEGRTVTMTLTGDEGVLTAVHHLTATPAGTRLAHRSRAEFHNPLLRLAAGAMKDRAKKRLRSDLERLRDRLVLAAR